MPVFNCPVDGCTASFDTDSTDATVEDAHNHIQAHRGVAPYEEGE